MLREMRDEDVWGTVRKVERWEMKIEVVMGGCEKGWEMKMGAARTVKRCEKGWEIKDEGGLCWEMKIEKHGREKFRVKMRVRAMLRDEDCETWVAARL
jgi:hypothetical protein